MTEKQQHDINVDQSGLKTGEKLVISRDSQGRVSEIKKVSTSCWVVTAHYGDPFHPNVCLIRDARDNLKENPIIGWLVKISDIIYQSIGKSRFGKWWIHSVHENQSSVPKNVSHFISEFILVIIKVNK